jgi:DNA-binding protein Fis
MEPMELEPAAHSRVRRCGQSGAIKRSLTIGGDLRREDGGITLSLLEVLMPSQLADQPSERQLVRSRARFEFSALDRACIRHLVGHTLARIECELILQTLHFNQGNRTRAATFLGISIRSLRDRIRSYRSRGENVPEPDSSASQSPTGRPLPALRH